MKQSRHRAAGFTLVEMLVSVVLIGLVSLTLIEAVRFASVGYERRLHASDEARTREHTMTELRNLLESAVPAVWKDDDGASKVWFAGEAERAQFVAPMRLLGDGSGLGLALVTLSLSSEDEPPRRLEAVYEPFGLGGEPPEPSTQVLAVGVAKFELSYFGRSSDFEFSSGESANDAEWHESWKDHVTLPQLVRMAAVDANGRVWPELVGAPRAPRPTE